MLKKSILCLMFITIFLSGGLCKLRSQEIIVQRDRAYLRQGPGSYFKVLTVVPVKTKLKALPDEEGWYKVTYKNQMGYLSTTVTTAKAGSNDVFAKMGTGKADVNVSRHGMSAGVKGFGERFSKAFKGNADFLTAAETYNLNPNEYAKFKKDTYKDINIKKLRKSYRLPAKEQPDYYTEAQEGFGLGTASAIAALGLYNNPVLQEYVNSIGHLVVEASDATDVGFKFFVLNIPEPNAYACPGGYIFITLGMLKTIKNESELACILAHEIAHVSHFHGLKEIDKRKNQIAADEVFSELDEELPDAYDEETALTEQELEDEAFGMYESLFQGRLDAYEQEADVYGMRYAVRAGYDPKGMRTSLTRLLNQKVNSNNQHYRQDILQMRLNWVEEELAARKYPTDLIVRANRWEKYAPK